MSNTQTYFAPRSAAKGAPLQLAMQRLWLTGQVLPAGARVVVQHVFRCEEDSPVEVIYSFPLPRDAALRRFRITGEGFEAESELKETMAAVKAYEEGIMQGSLSTLARQYGDGIVNLTVGNIRPKETVTVWLEIVAGVELRDDGFRFRFPFALAPSYHAHAKTAVLSSGEGEMELPTDKFGDVILPRFREDASALHQVGFELNVDGQLDFAEVASPSHAVSVKLESMRKARVALAIGHDVPTRDLVLDGRFKSVEPQVLAGEDRDGKRRFAVIVPSTSFGENADLPKRVVILLDRSGSMQGEPIAQARKAIAACLGALSESDLFGLVAFDSVPEVFHAAMQNGTRDNRDHAHAFLNQIDARGGTELVKGFLAAAQLLAGEGGDILILTDGQVFGTEIILADARSAGVRLHCLGIGSASQDRFLTLLARETGGVSRFVTPGERVDLAAVDLFASIGKPVALGLKAGANIQPQPSSTVFSGAPVLLFGEGDEIELTWDGGRLALPVSSNDDGLGETVWLLQGSRLITDWESHYPGVAAPATLEKRNQNRVAARLQELSRTYGLASREMSLVAVVKRAGDRSGELPSTRVVPVGTAGHAAFDAYFGASGRETRMAATLPEAFLSCAAPPSGAFMGGPVAPPSPMPSSPMPSGGSIAPREGLFRSLFRKAAPPKGGDETLLDLASRLDSDGGMPGDDAPSRAIASIVALMAFVSQGHTMSSGTFRSHVARLVKFLKAAGGRSDSRQQLIAAVVGMAERGTAPPGDWLGLAGKSGDHWKEAGRLVSSAASRHG